MFAACGGPDGDPPPGVQTGACYPNATCDGGLVCASDVCVAWDDDDGGTDTSAADTTFPPTSSGDAPSPGSTSGGGPAPPWETTEPDPSSSDGGADSGGPSDGCPFTPEEIVCSSYCAAHAAYLDACDPNNDITRRQCLDGCEFAMANGGYDDGLSLLAVGCIQLHGGDCDAVAQCLYDHDC